MQGIRPCPYCGREVEVIRLANDKKTGKKQYRIECKGCHRVVGKGLGFPADTVEEAKERIRQYEKEINRVMGIN